MSTNVLQKDALGLELGNERRQVRPEMTVIARASALPGMGERLARVSSGEEVETEFSVRWFRLTPCTPPLVRLLSFRIFFPER